MGNPDTNPQVEGQAFEQSTFSSEAVLLSEQDRIAHGAEWDAGLDRLRRGSVGFNTAKLLSDGVKSGLSLEIACSIALSIATPTYAEEVQKTLNAIIAYNTDQITPLGESR